MRRVHRGFRSGLPLAVGGVDGNRSNGSVVWVEGAFGVSEVLRVLAVWVHLIRVLEVYHVPKIWFESPLRLNVQLSNGRRLNPKQTPSFSTLTRTSDQIRVWMLRGLPCFLVKSGPERSPKWSILSTNTMLHN